MYHIRSEDIELPRYYEGDIENKYQNNNEEKGNNKKKL